MIVFYSLHFDSYRESCECLDTLEIRTARPKSLDVELSYLHLYNLDDFVYKGYICFHLRKLDQSNAETLMFFLVYQIEPCRLHWLAGRKYENNH